MRIELYEKFQVDQICKQLKDITIPLKGSDQADHICKQLQKQLPLPESYSELGEAPGHAF
jgi:hypothetical protein